MDGFIARGTKLSVALLAVNSGRLLVIRRAVVAHHCLLMAGQQPPKGGVGTKRAGQGGLHRLVVCLVAAVRAAEHARVLEVRAQT